MSAQIELRDAVAADAAEIARLSAQLGYPSDADTMRERLRMLLPDARHFIHVAAEGERLLGWVAAECRTSLESGESAEIVGLVVAEDAHRRGIGAQLAAAASDWARARGHTRLVVRSNILREGSHPFYERLGFARAKTQHVYQRPL